MSRTFRPLIRMHRKGKHRKYCAFEDCSMESLRKKRKWVEISEQCHKGFEEQTSSSIFWSHLSLEDCSRRKRKCKEVVAFVNGVASAPPCGTPRVEFQCRGLKRKIGCIDDATRLGRNEKIDHEYDLDKVLGKGKFGSVVLCRSKISGEEFACKILKKGKEIVHREVEIMQHLSGHCGLVTLKAVYEDDEFFHLVMELCSGGSLLDHMSKEGVYSEQKAANVIKELMVAIRYCHEMGVAHRDIKPENILLTMSGQLKLADFGLAVRILDGQSLTGVVGSPAYIAPEVLSGNYSEKVDIWSAGVLLHALLVGVLPFQGDSLKSVFESIKKEKLDFTSGVWESVSQPARDLLSRMLTRSVSTRLTADEVLRHPWISFYTEPTLKIPSPEPKNDITLTPKQKLTFSHGPESERRTLTPPKSLNDDSTPAVAIVVVEGQDGDLVDILAAAISRVRISEPKRSRTCSTTRPVKQECSSNLTSNLCTAF